MDSIESTLSAHPKADSPQNLASMFNQSIPLPTNKESPPDAPVRRSTRDIKRKKFDDEVIGVQQTPSTTPQASSSILIGHQGLSSASSLSQPIGKSPAKKQQRLSNITAAVEKTTPSNPANNNTFSASNNTTLKTSLGNSGTSLQVTVKAKPSGLNIVGSKLSPGITGTSKQPIVPIMGNTHAMTPQIQPLANINNTTVAPLASLLSPAAVPSTGGAKKRSKPGGANSKGGKKAPTTTTVNPTVFDINDVQRAPSNTDLYDVVNDVGRWLPTDDLALVTAVMQTSDLRTVYASVKFSCQFSLQDLQSRWYALLYDPIVSKHAQDRMRQLCPDTVASIVSNTLYCKDEERLLTEIPSKIEPTLKMFDDLLDKNANTFHYGRSARVLMNHWLEMRQFQLLKDQRVNMADGCHTFSDIEDDLDDEPSPFCLGENVIDRDVILMTSSERSLNKQVRKLETESNRYGVLIEAVTGLQQLVPDFDPTTIASLKGRLVRFLMKSREITIGRKSRDNDVDVDLNLEGPAFDISRRQASIKLRPTGDFYIVNDGHENIVYVESRPVMPGSKSKLHNGSVLEFGCIRLIFTINTEFIKAFKAESSKAVVSV